MAGHRVGDFCPVFASRICDIKSASCFSISCTFVRTVSILSAKNLQAPFSSMWMISPGATLMPATLTGVFTGQTDCSP
jgi:hypothetical protein